MRLRASHYLTLSARIGVGPANSRSYSLTPIDIISGEETNKAASINMQLLITN
jgi:hypothetical protein